MNKRNIAGVLFPDFIKDKIAGFIF